MAKRTMLVSDFDGTEVDETNGATIRVTYGDSETVHVADATAEQAKTLLTVKGKFIAREQQKRGRKPGSGEDGDSDGDNED